MDTYNDPSVHTIVLMKSAQTGGTEVLNNIVGYVISQDPGPMLMLQPTVEMGQAWSKDRLAPMLRDSQALTDKVSDPRSKTSDNTILHKLFAGGHLTIAGANSAASLASRPIRVLLADEVDRYPVSAGTEGDPLALAEKRLKTFWNRKVVVVSTPTIKGMSRIEAKFAVSDMQRYWVPCPHCGVFETLKWPFVRWPEGEPEKACYVCEHCGAEIHDNAKAAMLASGEWRAGGKFSGTRGFYINELYSPWVTWGQMASEFLEAKKLPETLKTWVNTALGETWEEQGERIEPDKLSSRAENYSVPPESVLVITAAVDLQDDRIEVEAEGWGLDFESWAIEHQVFYGDPSRPDVWKELDDWLLKEWRTADGRSLRLAAGCVDTGGHHTQMAYAFCKPRYARRIFAIKGVGGQGRPLVGRPSKSNAQSVRVFPVGVDTCKDIVFAHLKIEKPGPGYCHFPATYDEECFEQLTSEKVVTKYQRGFPRRVYVKTRHRNEMLDLRVYNRVALELLNVNWKRLAAQKAPATGAPVQAVAIETPPAPSSYTQRARRPLPPKRSFVTGWR